VQSSAFVLLVLLAECCGSAQPPVALGFGPLAEAPELALPSALAGVPLQAKSRRHRRIHSWFLCASISRVVC
jgi:hypothetical protein